MKTSSSKTGTAIVYFCKISNAVVPTQVRIVITYVQKIGPRRQRIRRIDPRNRQRRQQAGGGLDMVFLGRKAACSKLGKMMINDAKDYISTTYKKTKNKITSKKVKAVMVTGVDNYLVNRRIELISQKFN